MLEPPPVDVVDRHPTTIEVATDRCDARDCNATAYVYAELRTGTISYCGHHGTKYWARLNEQATVVIDLRHLIGT